MKSKLYRWYERHDKVINALVEIGQHLPGGGILKGVLDVINGNIKDNEEEVSKAHEEHVENVLLSVQGTLRDLVDDVEHLKGYQKDLPNDKLLGLINEEKHITDELEGSFSELTTTISYSVNILRKQDIMNESIMNGKYIIKECIGKGLQGAVYRAYNTLIDENVALKILSKSINEDQKKIANIKKEYKRLVSKLTHKNVVQYRDLDFSQERSQWFICMDYVDGKTLRGYINAQKNRQFEIKDIYNLLYPIGEALSYAHEQGVIHCDIKPENILLTDTSNIYLTDFGLARDTQSVSQTFTQELAGTLPYMAPEQYQGKNLSSATDTWSLAVIVYEMFTGKRPFEARNVAHYSNVISYEEPEAIGDKQLWGTLKRCLLKDPMERVQSPLLLLQELLKIKEDSAEKLKEVKSNSKDKIQENEKLQTNSKVGDNEVECRKTGFFDDIRSLHNDIIGAQKEENISNEIDDKESSHRSILDIINIEDEEVLEEDQFIGSFSKLYSMITESDFMSYEKDERIRNEEKYLKKLINKENNYETNENDRMDLAAYFDLLNKKNKPTDHYYAGKVHFYQLEYEEAKKHFSIDSNNPKSILYLSYMYTSKEIGPYLPEYSLQIIKNYTKNNLPNKDICYLLGMMAEFGYGMRKDEELAYEAYKQSIELETCDEMFSFERDTAKLLQYSSLYHEARDILVPQDGKLKDEYIIWNSFFGTKGNYKALFKCIKKLKDDREKDENNVDILLRLVKGYSELGSLAKNLNFILYNNEIRDIDLSGFTYDQEASLTLEELEVKNKLIEEEEHAYFLAGYVHNFLVSISKKYAYHSRTNISAGHIDYALETLKECADSGNLEAMLVIGSVCFNIKDRRESETDFIKEGLRYYEKAAELGDIWAIHKTARYYEDQMNNFLSAENNKIFFQQALSYYNKGGLKGNLESIYHIGNLYELNWPGVSSDFEKAFSYYYIAAKRGHLKSIEKIIDMYRYGNGVKKNEEKEKKWKRVYEKSTTVNKS